MERDDRVLSLWRAHELLASVPILFWATFHLWEQWAGFSGRAAYEARAAATSVGAIPLLAECVLILLPAVVWVALDVHLRISGSEPVDLRGAMAEKPEVAQRLGLLVRVSTWVLFAWLLYHTAWLFAPKLAGADPRYQWWLMQSGLGTWPHTIGHAIGITAFAVHVWGLFPRLAIAMGWVNTPEGRRGVRLSGIILGAFYLVLYAQLAGWYASGTSTVWPA